MDFKYGYKFTKTAEKDLDGIMQYIRNELFNPTSTINFFEKVFTNINNIRIFPFSGMIVQNDFLPNKNIRRIIIDNYILYYLVNEDIQEIIILRIVYGKRNLEEIYRTITE